MSKEAQEISQTAVWYFVGAAFTLTLGPLFFGGEESGGWQSIIFLTLGVVLIMCGGIQLHKEIRLRKETRAQEELSRLSQS